MTGASVFRSVPRTRRWDPIDHAVASLLGSPLSLLLAPALVLLGVAVLAWDYALLPPDPIDHVGYWLGLGLAYAGVAITGTTGRPGAGRQLAALAMLGAVLWLPYYLRSPDRLVFVDELYHRDVLARILETGHATAIPVTLFPIPGSFAGLEDVAVAIMGLTGLSMDGAIRVETLLIHVTIPCVSYLVARGIGLGRRGAFLAALVYAANTSFAFFHSVFSYETLGILFFLGAWALVAWYRAGPPGRVAQARLLRLLAVGVPIVAAIAVTHHISSYLLAATLVVAWLGARIQRARSARGIGLLALAAIAFAAGWFAIVGGQVGPYLADGLTTRFGTLGSSLLGPHAQTRALFTTADQPQLERVLAFTYPPLVLILSVLGVATAWRYRERSILWLPLALVGPIAWLATTPAVLTRAGELAYRSWPFVFLGLAGFAAIGLLEVGRRVSGWRPGMARLSVLALAGALLFGGISIGENQAGRFPTAPTTAAGGASNTPDVLAAAEWLRDSAGPGHLVATDVGTAAIFGTDGRQRILPWSAWYPFVVGNPKKIAGFLRETGTEYLVLDRRITTLPPRYGDYFGQPPIPASLDPGAPIPAALPAAIDAVPTLDRVYDGPNIVIWHVGGAPTAAVP